MTTTRSRRAMKRAKSTYRGIGARMRLIRATLNISEEEAAVAHGVTVKTYRRYEAGAEQRGSDGWLKYCRRFDISLDYYLSGNTHSLGQHLSINRGGKVSILPAITPHERQGLAKFGPTMVRHARYRISPRIV
jgi:transcriptional regulator with XRE-family HTH domain